MKQQILEECTKRGTCPLDRKQFDESFSGRDLTIQVRSAIDFAQQNGLAFGRSTGDQRFIFTRLQGAPEAIEFSRQTPPRHAPHRTNRRFQARPKRVGAASRPYGRSF